MSGAQYSNFGGWSHVGIATTYDAEKYRLHDLSVSGLFAILQTKKSKFKYGIDKLDIIRYASKADLKTFCPAIIFEDDNLPEDIRIQMAKMEGSYISHEDRFKVFLQQYSISAYHDTSDLYSRHRIKQSQFLILNVEHLLPSVFSPTEKHEAGPQIEWDKEKVMAYFTDNPNNWTEEEVNNNIFAAYKTD